MRLNEDHETAPTGDHRTMSPRKPRRGEAGFTLIELANVVMIMGLLALFAMPAIGSTTFAAKRVNCLDRQRRMFEGSLLYAMENFAPNGNMNVDQLTGSYIRQETAECPESVAVGYDDYTITFLAGEPIAITCDIMGAEHAWEPH